MSLFTLLTSQHNLLWHIAREAGMESLVECDQRGIAWRYRQQPERYWFKLDLHEAQNGVFYTVRVSPGEKRLEEHVQCEDFETPTSYSPSVHIVFFTWLECLKTQLREEARRGSADAPPPWVADALPKRLREIESQIDLLQAEAIDLRRMGELLWQTGEPLNEGVCRMFSSLGYAASPTVRGATYDVLVSLDSGKRLLIEVTGIEGAIAKKSGKISQMLQAIQDAQPGDRAILAVNAHRLKSLDQRSSIDVVTPEALTLLYGLKASIVTTETLYRVWLLGRRDQQAARQIVDALYDHLGGLFTVSLAAPERG